MALPIDDEFLVNSYVGEMLSIMSLCKWNGKTAEIWSLRPRGQVRRQGTLKGSIELGF